MHARLDATIHSLEKKLHSSTTVSAKAGLAFVLLGYYVVRAVVHAIDFLFRSPQRSFDLQSQFDTELGYTQSYAAHRNWHHVVRFGTLSYGAILAAGVLFVTATVQILDQDRFGTPVFAATFLVNSDDDTDDGTCDGGHCSLREAIDDANTTPGPDQIDITPGLGHIVIGSTLPALTEEVTINGDGNTVDCDGATMIGIQIQQPNVEINNLNVRECKSSGINITSTANNFTLSHLGLYENRDGIVIASSGATGGTISNSNIENSDVTGINVVTRTNLTFDDNRFENNTSHGLSATGLSSSTISANEFVGNGQRGITMNGGSGNTITGNFVGVYSDLINGNPNGNRGMELVNLVNPVVTSNHVHSNGAEGIMASGGSGHTYTGNTLKDHNQGGQVAMSLSGVNGATIGKNLAGVGSTNTFSGNTKALGIDGGSTGVVYRDNDFINNTEAVTIASGSNSDKELGSVQLFNDEEIKGTTDPNSTVDFYNYVVPTKTYTYRASVTADGEGHYSFKDDFSGINVVAAVSTHSVGSSVVELLNKGQYSDLDVSVADITATSADIVIDTDTDTTAVVKYNTTGDSEDPDTVDLELNNAAKLHIFELTNLEPNTTYYYSAAAKDAHTQQESLYNGNFTTLADDDTTAPVISAVQVIPSNTQVQFVWDTDEPAAGAVEFGTTDQLGTKYDENAGNVTNHVVTVTGLQAETEYFYSIGSVDPSGNAAKNPVASFTTLSDGDQFANQVTVRDGDTQQFITGGEDTTIVVNKEGGVTFKYSDSTGQYANNNHKMHFVVNQVDAATKDTEQEILNKKKAFNSKNVSKVHVKEEKLKLKKEYELRTQLLNGSGGAASAFAKRFNFTVAKSIGEFMSPTAEITHGVPRFMFVTHEPEVHIAIRDLTGVEVVGCDATTLEGIATCDMPYLPKPGDYTVTASGATGQTSITWFNSLAPRDSLVLDDRSPNFNARLTFSKNPSFSGITAADSVELYMDGIGPIVPTVADGDVGTVRSWNYTHTLFDLSPALHEIRVVHKGTNGKTINDTTYRFERVQAPVTPAVIAPTTDTFTSPNVVLQVIGADDLYASVNGNVFFEGNFVDGARQIDLGTVLPGVGTYDVQLWSRNKHNLESARVTRTISIVRPAAVSPIVEDTEESTPESTSEEVTNTLDASTLLEETTDTPAEDTTDITDDTTSTDIPVTPVVPVDTFNEGLDSDTDGLGDGIELLLEEVAVSNSGVDTDNDGISDAVELELGSDPAVADSDGDGIVDGLDAVFTPQQPLAPVVNLESIVQAEANASYEATGLEEPADYAPITPQLIELDEEQEIVLEDQLFTQVETKAQFTVVNDAATTVTETGGTTRVTIQNEIDPTELWDWLRGVHTSDSTTRFEVSGYIDMDEVTGVPLLLRNAQAVSLSTFFSSPTVKIAMAEDPDGRWTMQVPAELLPAGEHVVYAAGEVNGTRGEHVEVAKFVIEEETKLSNTTWLVLVNIGIAIVALVVTILMQLHKRKQLTHSAA